MKILATIMIAVIASASPAFAQAELPRGLFGVSVTGPSTDASARMRLGSEARPWIVAGEIGARLAPRLAIGVEAIDLGTATGATTGRSFRSTGQQRERAIIGLLRGRVAPGDRVAIDLVGGAGVMFQRHSAAEQACFIECVPGFTGELTHRAPAFVAGVDVPFRVGRHFSIAAIGRYYALRRGENSPAGPADPLRWQFEYRSSSRMGLGASARVTW